MAIKAAYAPGCHLTAHSSQQFLSPGAISLPRKAISSRGAATRTLFKQEENETAIPEEFLADRRQIGRGSFFFFPSLVARGIVCPMGCLFSPLHSVSDYSCCEAILRLPLVVSELRKNTAPAGMLRRHQAWSIPPPDPIPQQLCHTIYDQQATAFVTSTLRWERELDSHKPHKTGSGQNGSRLWI